MEMFSIAQFGVHSMNKEEDLINIVFDQTQSKPTNEFC